MTLRIGIVGLGIMGAIHARYLCKGEVQGARLAALCSRDAEKLEKAAAEFPGTPTFVRYEDLLASGLCDAVLIVTPHLEHPWMVREALAANHHVLVEKPLAVTVGEARTLLEEVARYPGLTVGIVYNQRTNPLYQKVRTLLAEGMLGRITRIDWLVTNWFRTNAYYALAPWRSTWSQGGGGLLINQSHHHLDLLGWLTGLSPARVTAIVTAGRFHPIEVEDDVHALIEFQPGEGGAAKSGGGAVCHFATTTGEYPGTNRLEIAGTRGKLVAENQVLTLTTTPVDTDQILQVDADPFAAPAVTATTLAFPPSVGEYRALTQNFVDALLHPGTPLIAPVTDAPHAIELANAMVLAGITRTPVSLPLSPDACSAFLARFPR